jgi:hypothetical protein
MKALERRLAKLEYELTPGRLAPWAKVPLEQWPDAVLEDFLRATCPKLPGVDALLADLSDGNLSALIAVVRGDRRKVPE